MVARKVAVVQNYVYLFLHNHIIKFETATFFFYLFTESSPFWNGGEKCIPSLTPYLFSLTIVNSACNRTRDRVNVKIKLDLGTS